MMFPIIPLFEKKHEKEKDKDYFNDATWDCDSQIISILMITIYNLFIIDLKLRVNDILGTIGKWVPQLLL